MFAFRPRYLRRSALVLLGATAGLAMAACTAIYRDHGYVPPEEELAEIVVGVDTRDSVIETVGEPGSSGILNDSGIYYISSRFRTFAYREPAVIERELVAITFDADGIVQGIERFSLADGVAVPLERRVTESSLRDQTFLRQLLGNLGRFAPGDFID